MKKILVWILGVTLLLVLVVMVIVGMFIFKKDRRVLMIYNRIATSQITTDKLDDFIWTDEVLKEKYATQKWNKITNNKLDGFTPKIPLTEKREILNNPGDVEKLNTYLKTSFNGAFTSYDYLEDDRGYKIKTKEELFARFAPVDNEQEAVSFVAVQRNLLYATTSVLMGSSITTDDGYLVQVVYEDMWGCSGKSYLPQGIVYRVNKNGTIEKVAEEKKKVSDKIKPCF